MSKWEKSWGGWGCRLGLSHKEIKQETFAVCIYTEQKTLQDMLLWLSQVGNKILLEYQHLLFLIKVLLFLSFHSRTHNEPLPVSYQSLLAQSLFSLSPCEVSFGFTKWVFSPLIKGKSRWFSAPGQSVPLALGEADKHKWLRHLQNKGNFNMKGTFCSPIHQTAPGLRHTTSSTEKRKDLKRL